MKAIVIGAGMVGLATAWHLQARDYDVVVLDRKGVAAGSSWGNAGYVAPGEAMPLADTSLWTYGPKALIDPDAALHVPFRVDPKLWGFLTRFAAHGTNRAWDTTMAGLTPIDKVALACFDELTNGDVKAKTTPGPFVIGFAVPEQAKGFLKAASGVERHGQDVPITKLSASEARQLAPALSDDVNLAYRLDGQRFIEPGPFVEKLADAVVARGGVIRTDASVVDILDGPSVRLANGDVLQADTVVIATGAWMPQLARKFGVKTKVQAGRGYSFTVATEEPVKHPMYFPFSRIACTPYQGRLRVAGTMEFRGPDEPYQERRVQAIIKNASRLLRGVDLSQREDEWVGSRPVTPDGLPLVGATRAPGVFVAGGHGMWGIVLGPATGKYLAQLIDEGTTAPEIAPFNPLR